MTAGIGRFLALPLRDQGRTLEAALCLLLVRVVFGVLPFARGLRLLRVAPGERHAGRIVAGEAEAVGRAVARAARHVPFRAVCLQQAFAALLMLRRRRLAATVHLGLARESDGAALAAHAWSRCGPVGVTGVDAAQGFVAVAAFTT